MNDAVHRQGFALEGHIKQDIASEQWSRKDGSTGPSVDTGDFMNSIVTNASVPWQATVSSDSPYAKWLEYGTSTRAKLFSGPRRHFGRSIDQRKPYILKAIKEATIKII